jgi:hypothetical protein
MRFYGILRTGIGPAIFDMSPQISPVASEQKPGLYRYSISIERPITLNHFDTDITESFVKTRAYENFQGL